MYHDDYKVPRPIKKNLSKVVLFHARLFVLADNYDYSLLAQLATSKINSVFDPLATDKSKLAFQPQYQFRILPILKVIYSIYGGQEIKSLLLKFVLKHFDTLV